MSRHIAPADGVHQLGDHASVAIHEQRAERLVAISACGGRQLEATAEVVDVDRVHGG